VVLKAVPLDVLDRFVARAFACSSCLSHVPLLSGYDLKILEKDHAELDIVLDSFTRTANRAIQLVQIDKSAAREKAGKLLGVAETIEAFLERHLSDEEELAVPIILLHRLRG